MEIACPHCMTRFKARVPENAARLKCGHCGGRFMFDKNAPPARRTFSGLSQHRPPALSPEGEDTAADATSDAPLVGKAFLQILEGPRQQRALLFSGPRVSFGTGEVGRDTDMPIKDGDPARGMFLIDEDRVALWPVYGIEVGGKKLGDGEFFEIPECCALNVGGTRLYASVLRRKAASEAKGSGKVDCLVLKNETRVIWYLLIKERVSFGMDNGRLTFDRDAMVEPLGRIHFTDKGWYLSRRGKKKITVGNKEVALNRGRPLLPGHEVLVGERIRLQFDILGPYDPFESFEGDL